MVKNTLLYIVVYEAYITVLEYPLKQVRFKKIPPWLVCEPSLFPRERDLFGTPNKALFFASKLVSRGIPVLL